MPCAQMQWFENRPSARLVLVHHPGVVVVGCRWAVKMTKLPNRHTHVESADARRQQQGGDQKSTVFAVAGLQKERFIWKLPRVVALPAAVFDLPGHEGRKDIGSIIESAFVSGSKEHGITTKLLQESADVLLQCPPHHGIVLRHKELPHVNVILSAGRM